MTRRSCVAERLLCDDDSLGSGCIRLSSAFMLEGVVLLRLHWFNPRYRAGWIVKIVDYECCATDSTCWSRVEGQVSWSLGDETLVGGEGD